MDMFTSMKAKYLFFGLLAAVIFGGAFLYKLISGSKTTSNGNSKNAELLTNMQHAVEKQYPEFSNFENQNSFAGHAIRSRSAQNDYYFAYLVLGSGLPVASATCFHVNQSGQVFKTGLFPDPLDSFIGYIDVDPVNCKGIK
jgi:hypothetical protein